MTEALSSTPVSNITAVPRIPNASFLDRGDVWTARGSVTVSNGAAIGSTYDLVRVPSNIRVVSAKFNNPAGGTGSAFNVGVYAVNKDNTLGAAISAALFASALACTAANVDVDITGQSTNYTNAKREQPLWQAAGLSADPGGMLAIVATNTAANASAFSIGVEVLMAR